MINLKVIRWKQRFQNLRKAFTLMKEGVDAFDNRNRTAHTYEEKIFREVLQNIRTKYYTALAELVTYLEKEA